MPDHQYEISKCCSHYKNRNNILKLFNSISYCMICSCFIFQNISSFELSSKTIKPNSFEINKDYNPSFGWLNKDSTKNNSFVNKKEYLKLRPSIIKNMKKVCSYFSLSLKTYFLSVEYFDKINSNTSSYNESTLYQISLFCIILASKFIENSAKALEVQSTLKDKVSKNYLIDEVFVLKLLDYDLNIYTSYDIFMDILYCGFIFENEDINYKQINLIYYNIQKILYTFSESNSYIDMTPKQIAISMMAFSRELMNLHPFTSNIQKIFMINKKNENLYIQGLKIIKKKIKIENEVKGGKKRIFA